MREQCQNNHRLFRQGLETHHVRHTVYRHRLRAVNIILETPFLFGGKRFIPGFAFQATSETLFVELLRGKKIMYIKKHHNTDGPINWQRT